MNKAFVENEMILVDNSITQAIIIEQCIGCGKRIVLEKHDEERFDCECKLSYCKVFDKDNSSFSIIIKCEHRQDILNSLKEYYYSNQTSVPAES